MGLIQLLSHWKNSHWLRWYSIKHKIKETIQLLKIPSLENHSEKLHLRLFRCNMHINMCYQALSAGTKLPRYISAANSWLNPDLSTHNYRPINKLILLGMLPAKLTHLMHWSSGQKDNRKKKRTHTSHTNPLAEHYARSWRCALYTAPSRCFGKFSASTSLENPLLLEDFR